MGKCDERVRAAATIRETSRISPSFDTPSARMALEIAARAVERGRHLTDAERVENLVKALSEEVEE